MYGAVLVVQWADGTVARYDRSMLHMFYPYFWEESEVGGASASGGLEG